MTKKIRVLQFICPVGFYGAERWVLALINNSDTNLVTHDLAVTDEPDNQDLEIVTQFPKGEGQTHKIIMKSRFDLSVVNKLVEIIKDRQIDIIHSHGYKSDILGLIAARKAGIKAISTPHGFGLPESFKLRMFVKLGIFSLRFFNQIVPLSKQLYDEVVDAGVSKKKITYVRNGVDLTEVESYRIKKSSQPAEVKKIGFIGQMIPRKNIKDILDIFDSVHKQMPNTVLQLLGDGESREEMELYSKQLSCRDAVQFLGFRHDRMDFLMNFDLFVMTSKDEGIPRCLMEALGMELAVAAYDIAGIDQLIEHNKTGLLAKLGDKETLTEYWLELLQNDEKSKKLAHQGLEFVNEHFSGKRMANEYLDVFNKLL